MINAKSFVLSCNCTIHTGNKIENLVMINRSNLTEIHLQMSKDKLILHFWDKISNAPPVIISFHYIINSLSNVGS